jgi:hypothetical protein
MSYKPQPIDTSNVHLSEDILELTELIARSVHDHWSLKRFSEGWTYGEKRDDLRKKHPSLISYEELAESEKEYDRTTALQTLMTIVAMGYKIEKV